MHWVSFEIKIFILYSILDSYIEVVRNQYLGRPYGITFYFFSSN